MNTFCDSCTETREIKEYTVKGDVFYWCKDCKECEV
jgi:hypothetical protein